jgi:hypothetical protein
VTEKHRLQEGGQGAADTQLAPTSWDDSADSKNDILVDDHSSSIKTKNQLQL